MKYPSESHLTTPIAVIVGSIIIAGAILTSAGQLSKYLGDSRMVAAPSAGTQAAAVKPAAKAVDAAAVRTVGSPFIGNPQAPVTMAYWFDYQCPFCKQLEKDTMRELVKNYVDTGKLKIVFKDFQFLGDDSQALGKVSRAVWNVAPGKFYAWHSAIFDAQGRENSGWATEEKIRSVTASVLGSAVADQVMALAKQNSVAYQNLMTADRTEAGNFGITGTPSSIVGKTLVVGARPYDSFKAAIDASLSGK